MFGELMRPFSGW